MDSATVPQTSDEQLNQLLKCTVCKKMLKNPKMLKCGHFACSDCLQSTHRDKYGYLCKLCEKFTPEADVIVVPLVEDILDMKSRPDSSRFTCFRCKKAESQFYCINCKAFHCEECRKDHDRFPLLMFHKWEDFKEGIL